VGSSLMSVASSGIEMERRSSSVSCPLRSQGRVCFRVSRLACSSRMRVSIGCRCLFVAVSRCEKACPGDDTVTTLSLEGAEWMICLERLGSTFACAEAGRSSGSWEVSSRVFGL
jgi:hypothetical protein